MAKKTKQPTLTDLELASQLLDAGGAPSEATLPLRLIKVAQNWLSRAAHSDGCQCAQCSSARKLVSKAISLGLIKVPPPYQVKATPKGS